MPDPIDIDTVKSKTLSFFERAQRAHTQDLVELSELGVSYFRQGVGDLSNLYPTHGYEMLAQIPDRFILSTEVAHRERTFVEVVAALQRKGHSGLSIRMVTTVIRRLIAQQVPDPDDDNGIRTIWVRSEERIAWITDTIKKQGNIAFVGPLFITTEDPNNDFKGAKPSSWMSAPMLFVSKDGKLGVGLCYLPLGLPTNIRCLSLKPKPEPNPREEAAGS